MDRHVVRSFATPSAASSTTTRRQTSRASLLATYNPLYHLIAIVRDPLLGKTPKALHWIFVGAVTLLGWTLTIHVMGKFRHRVVYWL
jgi:ABC-type polysaccharide/polyol phosphate export permease